MIAGGLATMTASAQDGGPVVFGEREEMENFRLYNLRAGVEFWTFWRGHETRSRDGEKIRSEELEFRETLDLSAQAFVMHPNFLQFDLFGRFGAQQLRSDLDDLTLRNLSDRELNEIDLDSPRRRGWTYDYIGEYDIAGTFLRESNAPLSLYSRRTQTYLTRQFGDTLESVMSEHGARLSLRGVRIPTEFAYFRRDQETRSRLSVLDFSLVQDTFIWDSHFAPADNQYLTWNYTYDDVRQRGILRESQSFRRHNALLSHNWDFGQDLKHNLRSSLSVFSEDGDLELTRVRWNEALRLRHTPRFETFYDYTLDYLERPGIDQTLHRGFAGFRHRLFESLTSVGTIGASRLTLDDGEPFTSDIYFGDLELQYTKAVPHGRLGASTGINYSHQEDSERNGAIQVIQEPQTFSSAGIVILNRRNIVPGSIVIMDANGIFTFTPGIDYTVQVFGDRVEIRRILGGDITDGQLVLIDYRVEVEPANTTTTLGWRFAARYDIDEGWLTGLGLYTRYTQQDQTRRSDANVFLQPADLRDLVLGVDYRIGYLTLLAERQWHDSSLAPFRAARVEGRYVHPLGQGSSILLTGVYQDIDRYEDEIQTQILTLTGRWNHQFNERWRAGLELQWRDERDRPGIHVQGFEQQLDFSWRHRQTSVYGLLRNANLESDLRDSSFQTIQFGIRREF